MLLDAKCSLRFTKLEKRSPAMAKAAIRVPISHPRSISDAQMDVATTDATMPRMVLAPQNGSAIDEKRAAVERSGKCGPEEFLGGDSRAVGHHQQDQQLQQQGALHNGAP